MSLTQINKAGLDELALDHVFTIGASGSSAYTFQGEGLNGTVNNPTLYLTRGKTYRFENGSGGHPIRIQSTSGASGTAYNTGVTNNAGSGTVIVEVQHDAPDVLYYQCTSHAAMNGILYITGALADGGVTTAKIGTGAVTGAKLADLSVSSGKIVSGAVTSTKIADGNVSTAKIGDQAVTLAKLPHGTSSNDGKFLRANNGADPSFESIPAGITVNNQADNRIITATSTTDTLNGESNLTFDGTSLTIGANAPQLKFNELNADPDYFINANAGELNFHDDTNNSTKLSIGTNKTVFPNNKVGIGTASPTEILHIKEGTNKNIHFTGGIGQIGNVTGFYAVNDANNAIVDIGMTGSTVRFGTTAGERGRFTGDGLTFNGDTAAANALDDYEEGTYTPTPNSGTASTSATDGQYTKIGNFCCVTASISLNNNGTSGQMVQISIPFTAAAGRSGSGVIRYSNASISDTITIHVNGGHASMDWYQFGGSGFTYGEASNNRYDFVLTYRTV